MQTPLISIIIPVYNVEKYLSECLDSVIAQTYQNWEAICVNDGSPDNCGAILDQYASTDPRIKVIHKENTGVSDTRNVGLKQAIGEYITFLDSDDMFYPQFLENMLNTIQRDKTDIACCTIRKEKDKGKNIIYKNRKSKIIKQPLIHKIRGKSPRINDVVWGKIYKRAIINEVFNTKIKNIAEDCLFLIKVMVKVSQMSFIKQKLIYYRNNNQSLTHKHLSKDIINDRWLWAEELYNTKTNHKYKKYLLQYISKEMIEKCIFVPFVLNCDYITFWEYSQIKYKNSNIQEILDIKFQKIKYIPIVYLFKNKKFDLLSKYLHIYQKIGKLNV